MNIHRMGPEGQIIEVVISGAGEMPADLLALIGISIGGSQSFFF